MRRISVSVLFLVVFLAPGLGAGLDTAPVPRPAPCHAPPGLHPQTAAFPPPAGGDRGFDVLSYDLDLDLDPATSRVSGRVAIGLVALEAGLVQVHLDLVAQLECLEVRRSGLDTPFSQEGDSLLVNLDPPLATAVPETLWVLYEGRPPSHGSFRAGLMFRKHSAGTIGEPADDVPIIANVSETWSAHSWWPCKDHPHDKARVSLTATVPDTLPLISNGVLMAVEEAGAGRRRFRWREEYPLPTYLVSLSASNYVSWRQDCPVTDFYGGTAVIDLGFHVFPHDYQDAQEDLAETCAAMEFLTGLLGPYPFAGEKYDQAEIKWGGAMEHPTAVSMPTYMFTGDGAYDLLVVHEMAHHWFGNSLTPGDWADIWLNEGFARYCEALWLEHTQGPEAFRLYMRQIGPLHHPDLFVGDGLLGDPDPILPNILVYDKGAWLLHALRQLCGDEAFFTLLREYANDPELVHGITRTADFQARAEAAAGRDLDRFFQAWLQSEAVPELHAGIRIHPGGEIGAVRISLQQLQEFWQEMAVPVALHCSGTEVPARLILDSRSREFELRVDCPVDSVSIDPQGMVLMRRSETPAPLLDVGHPWPNPVTAGEASFAVRLLEAANLQVRLYDARGRLLNHTETGLLPATGMEGDPRIWTWSPPGDPPLPAGVYWLEFRGLERRFVRKLTYLK